MNNVFCTQCGVKNNHGSRFCSACGNPLTAIAASQKNQIKKKTVAVEEEEESDETFVIPKKLDYEVEISTNTYKAEDLFKSPQIDESERTRGKKVQYKKLTQEELLAQSLKECAPSKIKDIDEV